MTTTASPHGYFISFEGLDGSGKTTQAAGLAERLRGLGQDVVLTREPGGSRGAEDIRQLLVEGPTDRWSPETEVLLFTAARRDHWERTIAPALARGAWVISDRFVDSTRVYQGVARSDLATMVDRLHAMVIERLPDLTVVIDLDPALAAARCAGRGGIDRFERMGAEFGERLRRGFRAIVEAEPERVRLVDGAGDEGEVAHRIDVTVASALGSPP